MATKRTQQELNILRQAVLDHCHQPMGAKDLAQILDTTYPTLIAIMDTLAAYHFLEIQYGNRHSHIGSRAKSFKTIIPILDPKLLNNDAVMSKPDKEPTTFGARKIEFNNEHYAKLRADTAREARKAQRKSSRTYVGISPVYNG